MKYFLKPLDIEATEPQFTLYKEVTKYDEVSEQEITFYEPSGQVCETSEAKNLQDEIEAKEKSMLAHDEAIADKRARYEAVKRAKN